MQIDGHESTRSCLMLYDSIVPGKKKILAIQGTRVAMAALASPSRGERVLSYPAGIDFLSSYDTLLFSER